MPYYQQAGELALGGEGYRLPTEAEWEYACRAGSRTRYSFGDDWLSLGDHAWFNGNAGGRTHPVGQKPSNAFGLHDMHGNAWEWCSDWQYDDFYRRSPADDPLGPPPTGAREHRGGSFDEDFRRARSACRWADGPRERNYNSGFRVARSQSAHHAEQKTVAAANGLAGQGALISLFNGKDLDGWEKRPEYGGDWKVIDGVLEGRGAGGGKAAVLVTNRQNYRDFRLRATLLYTDVFGTGHIQLRRSEWSGKWNGYLVTSGAGWNRTEDGQRRKIADQGTFPLIGSVAKLNGAHLYGPWGLLSKPIPYSSQRWNVIEITILKNRIYTKVNDVTVSEYVDDNEPYASGRIALVCNEASNVRFRSVEVQEIPSDAPGASPVSAVSPSAETTVRRHRDGKDLTGSGPASDTESGEGPVNNPIPSAHGQFTTLFDGRRLLGLKSAPEHRGTYEVVRGKGLLLAGPGAQAAAPRFL